MSVSRATSQHVLQVKTLYRQILKEQLNWAVSRELWLQHAMEIRYEFESNKELQDPGQIASQINRAKAWLITNKHPDPYTIPTQMGGTSFQRNTAPPLWVSFMIQSINPPIHRANSNSINCICESFCIDQSNHSIQLW